MQCFLKLESINGRVLFWSSVQEVMTNLTRGGLTGVVREHWAHTSLSPLHRTTAVGAEEGDPAGTLHLLLHEEGEERKKKKQNPGGVCVSLLTLSHRRTLPERTYNKSSRRTNPTAQRERTEEENFWLIAPWYFFFFSKPHLHITLEVRPVYCERGWDRYSFPSPCVWASLSRSMWKVSGEEEREGGWDKKWLSVIIVVKNTHTHAHLAWEHTTDWSIAMAAYLHDESGQVDWLCSAGQHIMWSWKCWGHGR